MMDAQQFPKLGASACVWRGGKVLLVERAKPPLGLWSLPGGHVEPGETVEDAARRELMEETGLTAELQHLVGVFDIIRRDANGILLIHYAVACYTGFAGDGDAIAGGDAAAVRWLDPENLEGLSLVPNIKAAVARARLVMDL